jgi:oligosaccharide repeat unit polymerase
MRLRLSIAISAILAFPFAIINGTISGWACAVLIVALVWLGSSEKESINPYILFLPTPISLLLYSDSVSKVFLPALTDDVQLVAILGIYSYTAGLLLIKSRSTPNPNYITHQYSFGVVLTLGLVPHALGILLTGLPVFANDVNAARAAYLLPIVGQFVIFLPITVLIAFQRRKRGLIAFSVAINLFLSLATASKFSALFTGLFVVYAYFRYDGHNLFLLKKSHLAMGTMLAVPFLFTAVFAVREDLDQTEYFWRNEVRFESEYLDTIGDYTYLPYVYLTTPWSNFAYVYDQRPDLDWGKRTVYPLLSVLQIEGLVQFDERPIRMVPFNTHSFPTDFFLDLGVVGVGLLSMLLGMLVKSTYRNALRRPDVFTEGIWISIGFASSMLFFSNHFTNLTYPVLSIVLFGAYRILSRTFRNSGKVDSNMARAIET